MPKIAYEPLKAGNITQGEEKICHQPRLLLFGGQTGRGTSLSEPDETRRMRRLIKPDLQTSPQQ